jgi:hypothetical protein
LQALIFLASLFLLKDIYIFSNTKQGGYVISFISFGDSKYLNSLQRIKQEALSSLFFESVEIYNENDLPKEIKHFCDHNPRGYGYWIWKSYLVNKKIKEIREDDILIYCDAGCTINRDGKQRFDDYIQMIKNNEFGILSFQMTHLEKNWTKEDVFKHFDAYDLADTGQLVATVIILRKNQHTSKIVDLWCETCINNKSLIDDSINLKNIYTLYDHRHDQSIFSIIRKKYGTLLLEDETWKFDSESNFDKKYPIWASRRK